MMNKELKHCLHQLKGKSYPKDIVLVFERNLPESYHALVDCVNSLDSETKASNALYVLFHLIRVKCSSNRQDFFCLVKRHALSQSRLVRSVAAQLLVQLVNFSEKMPEIAGFYIGNRFEIDQVLREAIELGLEYFSEKYVLSYLNNREK